MCFNCGAELILIDTGQNDKIVAALCKDGDDKALLIFNLSDADRIRITLSHKDLEDKFQNIFSGLTFTFSNEISFEMQPWQYIVYEKI